MWIILSLRTELCGRWRRHVDLSPDSVSVSWRISPGFSLRVQTHKHSSVSFGPQPTIRSAQSSSMTLKIQIAASYLTLLLIIVWCAVKNSKILTDKVIHHNLVVTI